MKCYECGGEYQDVQNARLRVDDRLIGTYYVNEVSYKECMGCKARLFSPENAEKREVSRAEVLENILRSMPLSDFMSAADAADALGITRQALHKHRRISRGFIYHTMFGGNRVYVKKSIERFLERGDGRYRLRDPESLPVVYDHGPHETKAHLADVFADNRSWVVGATGETEHSSIAGAAHIKETSYAYSR